MISVLLLDEHRAILHALTTTFEKEPDIQICCATTSVDEAFQVAETAHPDVLVSEVSLPCQYGLDVTERLASLLPSLKIVIYSLCDEHIYAKRALAAGASAYVMKSKPTQTVVDAVRAVVNQEIFLSAGVSSRLLNEVVGTSSEDGHITDRLTHREMTVFHLIGKGHATREIAEHLNVSRKTIESYRRQIREKLALEKPADLMRMAVSCIDASAAQHYESFI